MAKRMRTKLREIKEQLKATRHDGIDGQGKWLAQVLRGWMAYYAVPMSGSAIPAFRHHMIERWHGALMRRSQRHRLTWTRMKTIADRYLPIPRILHPWPEKRFLVTIQGGSPVRRGARRDLCGGRRVISVPTATARTDPPAMKEAWQIGAVEDVSKESRNGQG